MVAAHLQMVVEVEHLDRLGEVVELANTVARRNSILLEEVEEEPPPSRSHFDHSLVGSHRSHNLEVGEVEVLVVAKEQPHHQAEHKRYSYHCPVVVAMVQLVRILHVLRDRVPMELHLRMELVDPRGSLVQHCIQLDRNHLDRSRDSPQVHRWLVRQTTLA